MDYLLGQCDALEVNTLSDEDIERIWNEETLPASQVYQQREVENILGALTFFSAK